MDGKQVIIEKKYRYDNYLKIENIRDEMRHILQIMGII